MCRTYYPKYSLSILVGTYGLKLNQAVLFTCDFADKSARIRHIDERYFLSSPFEKELTRRLRVQIALHPYFSDTEYAPHVPEHAFLILYKVVAKRTLTHRITQQ